VDRQHLRRPPVVVDQFGGNEPIDPLGTEYS